MNEFIKYFRSFYGKRGIYAIKPPPKRHEITAGIFARGDKFEGDSVDREWIRDFILLKRGADPKTLEHKIELEERK